MLQNELHKLIPTGLFKTLTVENRTEDFLFLSNHVTNHPMNKKMFWTPQ